MRTNRTYTRPTLNPNYNPIPKTTMHTMFINSDKHTGCNYGKKGYIDNRETQDYTLTLHRQPRQYNIKHNPIETTSPETLALIASNSDTIQHIRHLVQNKITRVNARPKYKKVKAVK